MEVNLIDGTYELFASSGLRQTCSLFSHTVALAALAGVGQAQAFLEAA
jgi:hypothetical protein